MSEVLLSKNTILECNDLKNEKLEVPEWGGHVFIKVMTGAERDRFERSLMVGDKVVTDNARAKLACFTVVNQEGKRLFELKDFVVLGNKSARALQRIFEVAQKINGMTEDAIEEEVKN